MERERVAANLGLVAAALVVALTVLPYAFARPDSVGTYYAAGLVGPVFVSLLSVIVAITLRAAARRRSDPALAAGVAVTVSAFGLVLSLIWALPAREVVQSIPVPTWLGHHPLAVVLATLALLAAAGWYTRTVL